MSSIATGLVLLTPPPSPSRPMFEPLLDDEQVVLHQQRSLVLGCSFLCRCFPLPWMCVIALPATPKTAPLMPNAGRPPTTHCHWVLCSFEMECFRSTSVPSLWFPCVPSDPFCLVHSSLNGYQFASTVRSALQPPRGWMWSLGVGRLLFIFFPHLLFLGAVGDSLLAGHISCSLSLPSVRSPRIPIAPKLDSSGQARGFERVCLFQHSIRHRLIRPRGFLRFVHPCRAPA